jgi:hypothetical protein
VKSLEERWEEIKQDPVRISRVFKIVWIAAYSTLMLGIILILWFMMDAYLF